MAGTTPRGWPFFAPSDAEAIDEALDLARVDTRTRFVDLGCGDGTVLVAAARRGATVLGIECDRKLARTARRTLAAAGLAARGRVVVGDLFDDETWSMRPSAADGSTVLFSYLSPAMLQRMTPRLRALPGSTLVTVDFDVPDLVADDRRGAARLYRLPGRRRTTRPARIGWPAAATLCVMPPDICSLTCLEAIHDGGPVGVSLRGGLARHATAAVGTEAAERGRPVAVDIRWRERPAGTVTQGEVHVDGLPPHTVIVLFSPDDQGQWDLSCDGRRALIFRLRQHSRPRPTTTKELLAAAEGVYSDDSATASS